MMTRVRAWLHRTTAPKPTHRQIVRAELTSDLGEWLRMKGAHSIVADYAMLGPLGGESDRLRFILHSRRYMISVYTSGFESNGD